LVEQQAEAQKNWTIGTLSGNKLQSEALYQARVSSEFLKFSEAVSDLATELNQMRAQTLRSLRKLEATLSTKKELRNSRTRIRALNRSGETTATFLKTIDLNSGSVKAELRALIDH